MTSCLKDSVEKHLSTEEIVLFLKALRDQILTAFEAFEPTARFQRTPWDYQKGSGGGEISILRGDIFEKAAINWSGISGSQLPMQEESGPFFATGISLITHMHNPHAPTVHMNIRYIETANRFWFGGGYDLTPMGFPYEEDTTHFHGVAEKVLNDHLPGLYQEFAKNAKDYFYIPHWNKERGVGGIFFDHYNTGSFKNDYTMWKNVGRTFLEAILPIYRKRIHTPYEKKEKNLQNQMRAHYVEFNLLYDRGTKFGFQSGGNPQAILCSMPPVATW